MTGADLSAAKRSLLEQRLRGQSPGAAAAIPRRQDGSGPPPLSFAQERLWFMEQLVPGTAAYNIPLGLRLRGPLDAAALERALNGVVERHESLRTRFPAAADGRPALAIDERVRIELRAGADEPALAEDAARPFDLGAGPLLRAVLAPLGTDDHLLGITVHHLVSDGWSADLLLRELAALYRGSPLPPLELQYGDYAAWQRDHLRGETLERELGYWRRQLAGLGPLDLPTDRPRPNEPRFAGGRYGFGLDRDLVEAAAQLGRAHGATLYMTLLAAFQALLGRCSGQDDFAVGSPIAGRPRRELEGLIGLFVNVLTLRADLSGDPTFLELLRRTRENALDAYAHAELPFEQLVTALRVPRDLGRSPLFQAVLTLQNYSRRPIRLAGVAAEAIAVESGSTRFDLELAGWELDDGLLGVFTYRTDLFDETTIERLATHLETLLRSAVARPELRVSELDLLAPAERTLVVERWNDTSAEFPDGTTLPRLIEAQVERTPDAIAVELDGRRLTYRELNARANRLAHHLIGRGVGPEVLVAVRMERSLELVVALLAVLKAGGAYVPLDPDYPSERLDFMRRDSGAAVLLERLEECAGELDTNPRPPAWPDSAAYVIYTSGSTGRPKGVPNTHRGICNRLDWMQKAHGLGPADAVLQKTPVGFDVSVWELFWPLLAGARIVLARPGGHRDAGYLRDLIVERGVTTAHFVPSMLAAFLDEEGIEACRSLQRVICSGEELPPPTARRVFERLGCELHNLYGPTEAAIDVSAWRCEPALLDGLATVPIGRPIQNTRLYVLDRALRPVPVGVRGELHIGGAGLARGYHGRPGLTAERFVPDPFGPPGSRLYRTGDVARLRPDGAIEFLGRLDDQVKIRGQRIEPGEIASVLRAQPGVREAVVVARDDEPGDRRLVAYVVGEAAAGELRAALKAVLPDHMVPASFVPLDALPLSPNGKLDRRALPAPSRARAADVELVEPRTPAEVALAAIWRDVLKVDRLGIDDSFFDLGGHSLLATRAAALLRAALPAGALPVSVMDLFKRPTVRELAALMEAPEREPRGLLHELTRPVPAAERVRAFVCVPYGGGSAVVYQPLADALPRGHSLFAVAIPGHDVGLVEEPRPIADVAAQCVEEILAKVEGPLVLYGHCGVGSAFTVEVARRLEAAGRELEAVYIGAIFPFARPARGVLGLLARLREQEWLRNDRTHANWLRSLGADMAGLDPEQLRFIIRNLRHDTRAAEAYFTERLAARPEPLRAPVVAVIGERDSLTEFYEERYREWHFLSERAALVVLDEAGHFFLKYRASELAEILTTTHVALAAGARPAPRPTWRLQEVSETAAGGASGVAPSLRRFLAVAMGQLVSITGSALTQFVIPIWIYLQTRSLTQFAIFAVVGLVPGLVLAPLAGAIVDRSSRRAVMIAGDCAAGLTQVAMALLFWSGHLQVWQVYGLTACLSVALAFQRLAYTSAVPQLAPKRYLGHANGVVQMANGVAQFVVPLAAVALLAAIGLGGILALDVVSFAVAVTTAALVRFPATMAQTRREPLAAEIANGLRYSMGQRGFRAMLGFFALLNVFFSPLLILTTPLLLAFSSLATVGAVSFLGGLGATLGGLAMGVWGGPSHRRMRVMLALTVVLAGFCVVAGLRPAAVVVGAGVFGMLFWISIVNGIYTTIVQVKVPQRFHGRVFALNTMVAWSTLPVGFGLVAPLGARLFEPLMARGGPLASSVGAAIGAGPGRGIGLMYVAFGLVMAVIALGALRQRTLARFDDEVPDALPDDLVGAEALRARRSAA